MLSLRCSERPRSRSFVALALAGCAGLLCLGQAMAAPQGASRAHGSAVAAAPAAPAAVLYEQYNNASSIGGIESQDWNAPFDSFDDQAADDFVVPAGQSWSITGVDVDGYYVSGSGPAPSVRVFFYANSGTLPGALVASRPTNSYTTGTDAGDFVITLSSPVVLNPGTYWVSVQSSDSSNGRWFWNERTIQAGSPAVWQQPGDGGSHNCLTWKIKSQCNAGSAAVDQLFRLNGTSSSLVLYDQYNNASSIGGIESQDWNAPFDSFDDQAADDFVVPTGQSWSIIGVDVDGYYVSGSGPAPSVRVFFYANSGSLPATLVASRPTNSYTTGTDAGDFVITLSSPVVLNPGTYWISVQSSDSTNGRWFWNERTVQAGSPAVWQQPLDGGSHNCTTWKVKSQCNAGSAAVDQLYRLNGTVGSPTAVRAVSVSARVTPAGVALSWRLRAAGGVLGFDVWRRAGIAGSWVKLNARLIGTSASSGAIYRYVDRSARRGARYAYRVGTVFADGSVARSVVAVVARR